MLSLRWLGTLPGLAPGHHREIGTGSTTYPAQRIPHLQLGQYFCHQFLVLNVVNHRLAKGTTDSLHLRRIKVHSGIDATVRAHEADLKSKRIH